MSRPLLRRAPQPALLRLAESTAESAEIAFKTLWGSQAPPCCHSHIVAIASGLPLFHRSQCEVGATTYSGYPGISSVVTASFTRLKFLFFGHLAPKTLETVFVAVVPSSTAVTLRTDSSSKQTFGAPGAGTFLDGLGQKMDYRNEHAGSKTDVYLTGVL